MPNLYLKHRNTFLICFKVGYFSFPLLRKPRGIQRVLDSPATSGLGGFFLDLIKAAWGSRLFVASLTGIFLPLSLVSQIATQAFAIAMIRGNKSLCATQLMIDPLTTSRLHIFITLFSTILLLPSHESEVLLPPGKECSFIFTLLHLTFGIIIPSAPLALQKLNNVLPGGGGSHKIAICWIVFCLTWALALLITSLTI